MEVSKRLVKPFSIGLVLILILYALGIRWGHPKDGLGNALGSAKSGLVIYHKVNDFQVGTKVVTGVDLPNKGPMLAVVAAVSGDKVDVQTGSKMIRVSKKQISGKLLLVIPFIGSILSVIGL